VIPGLTSLPPAGTDSTGMTTPPLSPSSKTAGLLPSLITYPVSPSVSSDSALSSPAGHLPLRPIPQATAEQMQANFIGCLVESRNDTVLESEEYRLKSEALVLELEDVRREKAELELKYKRVCDMNKQYNNMIAQLKPEQGAS
jgi:hypothetical protein